MNQRKQQPTQHFMVCRVHDTVCTNENYSILHQIIGFYPHLSS